MTGRKLGFDRATLGDNIIQETDAVLTMSAVIAREIVQDYPEGRAYKPAEELEKSAWTADGRWVATMAHPETGLLTRRADVKGKMSDIVFRRDITDPKTKRPMIRGIQANVTWFKDKVPADVISDIKSGTLRDVSIGFTYESDATPGEWNGEKYDFVQRNIFIDHLAAPVPAGRCPSPMCGIGVDSLLIGTPIATSKEMDAMNVKEIEGKIEELRSKRDELRGRIDAKYKAMKPEPQDPEIQKLYEQLEDLDSEIKAYRELKVQRIVEGGDCPICKRIEELGVHEASKRLAAAFGADATKALDDPAPQAPQNTPPPADNPVNTPLANTPRTPPAEPPKKETQPSAEEVVAKSEELLEMWRRLGDKSPTV